jgi:hypothetical protein
MADKGRIFLSWCDNGTVDGKFAEGIIYTIIGGHLPIAQASRIQGNQIGRQRQTAFDYWYDKTDMEWILWVDSDIVLNHDAIMKVWDTANVALRPAVAGTYFISKENEQALMQPFPALFNAKEGDPYTMQYVHPLAFNEVIKVDYAGYGFFLMHRSVAKKMREVHGERSFFMETSDGDDGKFIGEDIRFFMMMKEAGIPLHAHTGAVVQHMKRFSFDAEFYRLYWVNQLRAEVLEKAKEARE